MSAGLVIIRGGGDLGTGTALRLARSGYRVVVLETEQPAVVRRRAAVAEAVFAGRASVEDVTGERVDAVHVGRWLEEHTDPLLIPVVVDPAGSTLRELAPAAVVDARMAKRNLGTRRDDAPVTVGLGPGFTAGVDVDVVVETNRGHSLGRTITEGGASPDTGVPAPVMGVAGDRLLRAPASGRFSALVGIGDIVSSGDAVGRVAGQCVVARTGGVVRGLVADGLEVRDGQKIGDVDPRGPAIDPAAVSDKALAVGGGVLEALLGRGVLPVRTA
jgi:xanthine dehydrogenase accessory factor